MFKFKNFFLIFILSLIFQIIKADFPECNRILVEGEGETVNKILQDFGEIKNTLNYLKLNNEICENRNITKKDLPFFDERYDKLPHKCKLNTLPKDCASATACTKRSGIYKILVQEYSNDTFHVACDVETENGDWLVIQRRQDGSVDFNRNWEEHENGFGDIDGEFFIGLKKLHALTNYNGLQELLIVLENVNAAKVYAKYQAFNIGNQTDSYTLRKLGKYSGTAGNSLHYHIGMKFTTKDRDNDECVKNCAVLHNGAWWYKNCCYSSLNGKYGEDTSYKGINWKTFGGYGPSLTYAKMMIRRSRNFN